MPPSRITTIARVGHQSLAVTEIGVGEPLVLLHGAGPGSSGTASFERNIDYLARRYRVIVPDLPGFGASSKNLNPADPFGDAADAIAALLEHMCISAACIIGHSFGGATALRLAMDHPAVPRRLLVIAPAGINTSRQVPTAGVRALIGYYAGEGPSRIKLDRLLRTYLVADPTVITDDLIDQRYRMTLDPAVLDNPPLAPLTQLRALRRLRRLDLTRDRRLAAITAPTLVLWGARDRIARPSDGLTLAERLPDCTLHVIPRAGHWTQWEAAHHVNRAAIGFLRPTRNRSSATTPATNAEFVAGRRRHRQEQP